MSRKNRRLLAASAISLIGLLLSLALDHLGALEYPEGKMTDLRFVHSAPPPLGPSPVAVVLVDDASIDALANLLGRWPWPRAIWGEVIQYLKEAGARQIVFDILFTEYQRPKDKDGQLDPNDLALAQATANGADIQHAVQIVRDRDDDFNSTLLNRPMPKEFVERFAYSQVTSLVEPKRAANNFYLPFPELLEFSPRIGVVEFAPDPDGIFRRTPLLRNYQGKWFPATALSLFTKPDTPIHQTEKTLRVNEMDVPLLQNQAYLINMRKDIPQYSMSGLLASIRAKQTGATPILNASEFRDKIVFLGVSAVGGNDLKATVLGPNTPGVLLHASAVDNLISRDFIRAPNQILLGAGVLVLSMFCAYSIAFAASAWLQLFVPLIALATYGIFSFLIFRQAAFLLPFTYPMLTLLFGAGGSYFYRSFSEGKERRRVRKMLSQFVSPVVLKEVMDKRQGLHAEVGVRENMTILFSDVRGFTTLSEKLPAEKVVEMLNYYLNEMVDAVFKFQGTLDKFVGDAVMAFWGAPIRTPLHPVQAAQAAIEMIERLAKVNEEFRRRGWPELAIGVGLHTGDVILGNIGSEKKLEYTVIGDNVNLSSRIEGLTKEYHAQILFSETTYERVRETIPSKILDRVRVKGKEKPIAIYAPLLGGETAETGRAYESAFSHYVAGRFSEAAAAYGALRSSATAHGAADYCAMMIERCEEYLAHPPGGAWEGVHVMKTK